MLSYAKSGTARTGDQLNGFKKGKTQQFKLLNELLNERISQKKWSIPLRESILCIVTVGFFNHCAL